MIDYMLIDAFFLNKFLLNFNYGSKKFFCPQNFYYNNFLKLNNQIIVYIFL